MLKNISANEPLVAAATELFEQTLNALLEARAAEGEKLKPGILERLAEIERTVGEVRDWLAVLPPRCGLGCTSA